MAKKTTSFRIEPITLYGLDKVSAEEKISLNTLVNQVLSDYINWERAAVKSGWILVRPEMMKSLVNKLDEKEIQRFAIHLAKQVTKDTLLAMRGKYDLQSWLTVTRYRSIKSGFQHQELKKKGEVSIIITHGMGLKWSLFHKWYYRQMIRDLGRSAAIDYTHKTLVINIKKENK